MARRSKTNAIEKVLTGVLIGLLIGCQIEDTSHKETSNDLSDELIRPCGADQYLHLIGQNKSGLDGLDLPENARVAGPDDVVTTDFIAQRLNIHYDTSKTIIRVMCG